MDLNARCFVAQGYKTIYPNIAVASLGPFVSRPPIAAAIDRRDPVNSLETLMRRFLYSKWFFLILAVVCAVDLFADVAEEIWGRGFLNIIAFGLDCFVVLLSGWIFAVRIPIDVNKDSGDVNNGSGRM